MEGVCALRETPQHCAGRSQALQFRGAVLKLVS
jgi:hypothetical protein